MHSLFTMIVIDYSEYVSKLSPRAQYHLSSALDWNTGGVNKDLDDLADFMGNLEQITSALDIPEVCVQDLRKDYCHEDQNLKR